jgi:hypothetical protein
MRSRAAAWEVAAPASRCRLLESNARDDDDAGACVADLRQRIEAAQEISTRLSDSMMMTLGVGELLYAPSAAAMPPICTFTCALARRRSSPAA